jgi:hypothetical protein
VDRRSFLRLVGFGAGAAAAGLVLPEPVRRYWQVPRSAPVGRSRDWVQRGGAYNAAFDAGVGAVTERLALVKAPDAGFRLQMEGLPDDFFEPYVLPRKPIDGATARIVIDGVDRTEEAFAAFERGETKALPEARAVELVWETGPFSAWKDGADWTVERVDAAPAGPQRFAYFRIG